MPNKLWCLIAVCVTAVKSHVPNKLWCLIDVCVTAVKSHVPNKLSCLIAVCVTAVKQGVSSHGKPGKVMEFYFLFPGMEKSWNLTPGFGKFLKVMEIITHPLAKLCCLVPLLNPAHQSTRVIDV